MSFLPLASFLGSRLWTPRAIARLLPPPVFFSFFPPLLGFFLLGRCSLVKRLCPPPPSKAFVLRPLPPLALLFLSFSPLGSFYPFRFEFPISFRLQPLFHVYSTLPVKILIHFCDFCSYCFFSSSRCFSLFHPANPSPSHVKSPPSVLDY